MSEEEGRVHEVRVRGFGSVDDAVAAQEVVARLLCPDESHRGPCEIPWSTGVADEPGTPGGAVLVVGVLTTARRAEGLLERVLDAVGPEHAVALGEADPEDYAELVEQHRIEAGLTS
ncbi:hypothetical protein EIL87_17215 [Saccharopolyspora rhizosphaerae]|uniref:Uncharacterized protein n=1 Tax=Saccharopolyspora rhizosphaerae TaxID=2492662 RepID=A0A426JRG2_9PSEU|nr:hypothetical protein [Saccharopolyspora rhizosphaerae]RRO15741.1 hypothetical protein EIL87_17215 [Saccharopolyspora rhizosphaerae]